MKIEQIGLQKVDNGWIMRVEFDEDSMKDEPTNPFYSFWGGKPRSCVTRVFYSLQDVANVLFQIEAQQQKEKA